MEYTINKSYYPGLLTDHVLSTSHQMKETSFPGGRGTTRFSFYDVDDIK